MTRFDYEFVASKFYDDEDELRLLHREAICDYAGLPYLATDPEFYQFTKGLKKYGLRVGLDFKPILHDKTLKPTGWWTPHPIRDTRLILLKAEFKDEWYRKVLQIDQIVNSTPNDHDYVLRSLRFTARILEAAFLEVSDIVEQEVTDYDQVVEELQEAYDDGERTYELIA